MKNWFSAFFPFLGLCIGTGCTGPGASGVPAVKNFDVKSYMGEWYEIARLPNSFQKGMTRVKASYTLNPDGTVKVVNSGMKEGEKRSITGKAWLAGAKDEGELRVRFFFPFSSPYRIIRLKDDYSVAVVEGCDRYYLWILARKPQLPPEEYRELTAWLREKGFAVDKLLLTDQRRP